jgi:ribosome maturation factor RimP
LKPTLLIGVCCWLSLALARAQAADPVRVRLDNAKASYVEEIESQRKALVDALDRKEESARNAGNKKLVDQVKAEREAFLNNGTLPKAVPTTAYTKSMSQAKVKVEAAFVAAVKEYVMAKQDAEADAVEKERKDFLANPRTTSDLDRLLVKNSVWSGPKHNDPSPKVPKGATFDVSLRITNRSGKRFEGSLKLGESNTVSVEGTVDGNSIEFASEKKKAFEHTFKGKLKEKTLELTFDGMSNYGDKVKGTARLTLSESK